MSLKLDRIIDVSVTTTKVGVTTATFNQGLIVGNSDIIPVSTRITSYDGLDEMLTAGFTTSSPEYIAAALYFDADSAPDTVWIGRQDLTSISAITLANGGVNYNIDDVLTLTQTSASGGTATVTAIINGTITTLAVDAAGSGYAVNDVLTLVQSGASGGTATVTSINGTGGVTGITLTTGGTDYSVATGLTTTVSPSGGTGCTINVTAIENGTVSAILLTSIGTGYSVATGLATTVNPTGGTGCTINVTAINGESLATAIAACRTAGLAWYSCYACGATKSDHIAIMSYLKSATPASTYFYDTEDADALSGASGNIFSTLKGLSYTRCLGIYSTTTYAGAAVMGEAMGLNTGLANSAFTLKFKTLTGVTAEDLTTAQVNIIEGNNGNVYVNYASEYDIFEQGKMAYNYYFDQVLYQDMLTNYIQIEVMNLLTSNNKIPLTDAGITSIMNVINAQCTALQTIGYIASSGTWSGSTVLNVSSGDTISNGFVTQAPKVSTLTTAKRAAREAPPIYVCLIEAGAVHSVSVGIYIQS